MSEEKFTILTQEETQNIITAINEINETLKKKFNQYPLLDRWLTPEETMDILKVSKRQLQKYRDSRQINFSKISGKIFFKAGDIDKFLNDHYSGSQK